MNEESAGAKSLEPGVRLVKVALITALGYLPFVTFEPSFFLLLWSAVPGGIRFFGLVGVVAGSLVVAVSVAPLEGYQLERSRLVPREDS